MDEELNDLIAKHHHELRTKDGLDNSAVLHALADVESSHGARHLATKHEPAYCYGGFYYKSPNGEDLRRLSHVYGCLAHSSFSSWQLLFLAAYEEGFRGDPCELRNDAEAIHWVIRFINRRIYDRYLRLSLEGLADAWNSGSARDLNVPKEYIARFVAAYTKRTSDA
jgi:hypothetical protein